MHLTREQCRDLDRRAMTDFAVPGVVLMENAGREMARLLLSRGVAGPVVVCCGKGNNGGDGFVIARHLDNAGVPVRVLLFADPATLEGDAAVNYGILARSGLAVEVLPEKVDLAGAEWVVDALFGTGLTVAPRPPFDAVIAAINASGARVLAVDIPSGLDADTGKPLGAAVRADLTATVAALKVGFAAPEAAKWLGEVHVVDMGAPRAALRGV